MRWRRRLRPAPSLLFFRPRSNAVEAGIVASLNRPGGSITGVSQLLTATVPKQLQLIHEVAPAQNVAFLLNQTNPLYSNSFLKDLEAAANTLGAKLHLLHASTENDFDPAFEMLERLEAGALVVGPDLFFLSRRDRLVALAARHSVPAIYPWREAAMAGGLMSYASSQADTYRQVAIYTARVLKGDKPADLPTIHQGRAGTQPQNCQGVRDYVPASAARPRRRGDRIAVQFAAPAHGRLWH